ncbi:MAG: hypothetical protein E3K37_00285 [Candidatus Kuenenia sp.]|nr:hypothetical protein [Candidatus Kuenenia hertensis]
MFAGDEILAQKVGELDKMKLKGSELINEFANVMKDWDPRVGSQAISSYGVRHSLV